MRSVLEVADIFRRHGAAYREARGRHLSRGQRRVMGAIETCRSAALGGHVEQCNGCGQLRVAYNSCRNRHCPKCQGLARAQWLADRQSELLPVPYFHVVFTCRRRSPRSLSTIRPSSMASCSRPPPRRCASSLPIPRHLGAEIGLVAVLHTWGQNLHHHPHVHCVVPGGGPSADKTRWIGCRPGFFLPVKVLSRLYRRLFMTRLRVAFEAGQLRFFGDLAHLAAPAAFATWLRPLRTIRWVVYAKRPFGGPEQVLDYLGRYTHRVAIANSRLVGLADGPGQLPLEGLSPPRSAKGDDPRRRRVHPPLPAPRPARRLPSHPSLRLSRQWRARRQAGPLPPSAGAPRAGAACPCCRLPRALPPADWPLTRPLSLLRRPHDRNRRHSPCPHFRRCRSLEHLMITMRDPIRALCPGPASAIDTVTPLSLPSAQRQTVFWRHPPSRGDLRRMRSRRPFRRYQRPRRDGLFRTKNSRRE